ncbi:MAG: dockerin type I repeat-containing protein [Ruminococcus sp.]|nr:dockerin type I repeat-containing protein [Ruminococcus sp.]
MKNILKKTLTMCVAVTMAISSVSACTFSVNAVEEETPSDEGIFYFDVASCGWKEYADNNPKYIFCHIYSYDNTGSWTAWHSKGERCSYDSNTGIATYNIQTGIRKGATSLENLTTDNKYLVIFSTGKGDETYPILMNTACYGDTLYARDATQTYENVYDSEIHYIAVEWKNNQLNSPLLITSTGKVQGNDFAYGTNQNTIIGDNIIQFNWYGYDYDKTNMLLSIAKSFTIDKNELIQYVTDKILNNDELTENKKEEILENCMHCISILTQNYYKPEISIDFKNSYMKEYLDKNPDKLYCHIYAYNSDGFNNDYWTAWQSKGEKCTYDPETGIGKYALNTGVEKGATNLLKINKDTNFLIIFSTGDGNETYPILLNSKLLTDRLVCYDKQADWSGVFKAETHCIWSNMYYTIGEAKSIDRNGKIIGQTYAYGTDENTITAEFIINNNADYNSINNLPEIMENLKTDTETLSDEICSSLKYKHKELTDAEIYSLQSRCLSILSFYTTPDSKFGDSNNDNIINISDATEIQKQIVQLYSQADYNCYKADVNHDGIVDVQDATEIQKYLVGMPSTLTE